MKAFYGLLIFLLVGINTKVFAQAPPNCPPSFSAGYTITGDSVSFCNDGVNLQINPYSNLFSTDSYSVNSISYNPYAWVGANNILVGQDDIWSGVVNLPFLFCFFGQKYNQVVIGANGQVGFDITQAGLGNAWASAGTVAPSSNAAMDNTIMAPYHDIDPSVFYAGSNITWDIYGTAPCRYMVISWDSIPMFSCNNIHASQQVVLFESTYLIDINIKEKPLCANWNTGTAHEGIQNANGTVAFMVPGRNGTQWTASNDSYRFTPAGMNASTNYLYYWVDVPTGDTLGTGTTLSYYPTTNTQVTVLCYAITDCDSVLAGDNDTINVIVTGGTIPDFTPELHLGCNQDTVKFINTSSWTTAGTPIFSWSFGDGGTSTSFSPSHIYTTQGVYNVTLIATNAICADTIVKTIDIQHPLNAQFTVDKTNLCFGNNDLITATSTSVPINAFHSFNWGDGTITNTNPSTHTYAAPGNYNVVLTIQDTLGCIDTDTKNITVDLAAQADFLAELHLGCVDDTVQFTLVNQNNPPGTNYFWWFGDGAVSSQANPTHTYFNQNTYNIMCVTFSGQCSDTAYGTVNLIHPLNAILGIAPDSVCIGTAINASGINSTPATTLSYTFDWGDGTNDVTTTGVASHFYTNAGSYPVVLTITDTLGCTLTDAHNVYIDYPPYGNFTLSDSSICVGQSILIIDSFAPSMKNFTYNFGDGTTISDIKNPMHVYDNSNASPGFTITLTTNYFVCPSTTESKTVEVNSYPIIDLGPDTAICPGVNGSVLLADLNSNANIYEWSTGATQPSIVVSQPGYYWVRANNKECSSTDSIWVKQDCYISIPNSFSPNSDGTNDYFLPREFLSSGLTSFKMSIFNRWGEKIFYTSELLGRGWDGKYNGQDQPQGVYVYMIEATFKNNISKSFTGNVTLIR
ncbi:MAG: PKD domain-containing protein [Chitinophagaceae bacterium]